MNCSRLGGCRNRLAAALCEAAFQPQTDPVVRDYMMQHLGHLWEQAGSRPDIDQALWRGVGTQDETTPGSSLIALHKGYERDGNQKGMERVKKESLRLAQDPHASLAVRTTALSLSGSSSQGRALAENLIADAGTPIILRRVAEHALRE